MSSCLQALFSIMIIFQKASKAEVFVVAFALLVGLLNAAKTQRICLQKGFSAVIGHSRLIYKEALQRLKHFQTLIHGEQQERTGTATLKGFLKFNIRLS